MTKVLFLRGKRAFPYKFKKFEEIHARDAFSPIDPQVGAAFIIKAAELDIAMRLVKLRPMFKRTFFIPRGGGKWVVDAAILIPTSQALSISVQKTALIDMTGDQLTNMVQPFWALPLFRIALLDAKDLLGYTMIAMVFGFLIMALGLTFLPAG